MANEVDIARRMTGYERLKRWRSNHPQEYRALGVRQYRASDAKLSRRTDWRRIWRAVEEGKSSPVTRDGFALVLKASMEPIGRGALRRLQPAYRAARLDRPLERGERALAHYTRVTGEDGASGWIVLEPLTFLTAEELRKLASLQAREERLG